MEKSGVKLKPDSTLRKRLFVEESFSHPAKMHIGMFQEILARYDIQPGSLLLDPMAGSGTCLLACLQGINVVANEMEQHFINPMIASGMKMGVLAERKFLITPETYYHLVPGMVHGWHVMVDGAVAGKAKNEDELLRIQDQLGSQANLLPGFEPVIEIKEADWEEPQRIAVSKAVYDSLPVGERRIEAAKWYLPGMCNNSPGLGYQMGQALIIRGDARMLPLASADSIITSPPYEDSQSSVGGNQLDRVNITYQPDPATAHRRNVPSGVQRPALGYTRPTDARSLPLGTADCVVTSPPWQDEREGSGIAKTGAPEDTKKYLTKWGYTRPDAIITSPPYEGTEVARSTTSEGNKAYRSGQWKGDLTKDWGLEKGYTRPDVVVTSPPYADMADAKRHPGDGLESEKGHVLGYTRPDVVVTSPPYEGSIQGEPGIDWSKGHRGDKLRDYTREASHARDVASLSGYTRPDVVVTSPPYEGILHHGDGEPLRQRKYERWLAGEFQCTRPDNLAPTASISATGGLGGYSYSTTDRTNIGNLRNADYWQSMQQVYQECHRVLKDAGLMVLVVKGYTRDHEYVDLPQQTVDLVETLGFKLIDRWERELWQLSFWRILQSRKHGLDERLKYETVIAFRKK